MLNQLNILKMLCFFVLLSSCSLGIEVTDISSSLPNLVSQFEFEFDENYVELKNGNIQLKPLDLEHSGEDF